jgi:hypothetical protein
MKKKKKKCKGKKKKKNFFKLRIIEKIKSIMKYDKHIND